MSRWADPEEWRKLQSGEGCPICLSIQREGKCKGTVAELEACYLTTQPEQPVRGYCCLVLKRHAVELHDLEEAEAAALMKDIRAVSEALQHTTGAVKINLEIHGNTIPHLHAHFYPRYVGDRFENGPIDWRGPWLPALSPDEFRSFVGGLCTALAEV